MYVFVVGKVFCLWGGFVAPVLGLFADGDVECAVGLCGYFLGVGDYFEEVVAYLLRSVDCFLTE